MTTKRSSILIALSATALVIILHLALRSTPLTLFILFFIWERVFETHFSVKVYATSDLTADKHLREVIRLFSIMVIASILEFYFSGRKVVLSFTVLGFSLLSLSFILRWSAIKAAGSDWATDTFAIPATVQRDGPYRFMRHPYYLGVVLEAISFPLILNSWFSALFSTLAVIPAEIRRALLEEKNLSDELGWSYIKFKREVNRFLPSFLIRKCYDRRNVPLPIEFERRGHPERRRREETLTFVDRRKITRVRKGHLRK